MSDLAPHEQHRPGQRKLRRRIGVRVVIASLLGSIVISALMSALQVYYTYRQNIQSAQQRFLQIETGYLPSLADSLWEVNQAGVDALLDGIASLPDVGRVELIDEMQKASVRNADVGEAVDQREFILRYRRNESSDEMGILRVSLTDHQIIAQLKSHAIDIGAMIFAALFVNSLVVLALLYRMITRHVNSIARFASSIDATSMEKPFSLRRQPRAPGASDELDQVVDALNAMQRRLREELVRRTAVEQDLRQHHDNLEAQVTERTLAYNASAAQLGIAADVAELGIWSMDIDSGTLLWNQRMFEIYGVPPAQRSDDAASRYWNERVHPEDLERTLAALKHAIDTQTLYSDQFRIIDGNGLIRHVRARAQVVFDADGRPVKVTGINYDITEQIEIENYLKHAKEEAEAGARTKAEFLAAMSHEIRTPMNGVLGMLNLLLRTGLDQEQRRRLQIARNSADHLLTVINDILDFSKIDAGKMTIDAVDFDLVQQIGDSVQSLSLRAQEKGLELIADVSALNLAWVRGDPGRLRQILVNLIGNAIKFTERGEVIVNCRQHVQGDVVYLSVSISDSGIGIADEKIASLFAAFSQVDASMTRRFGGTGLGLVISKKLCELMGGDINVTSTAGEGSCFTFDILLAPARSEQESQTRPDLQGLDILVVDDNDTSRDLLGHQLIACGAMVTLAASAQEALKICERQARSGAAHVFDIGIVDMDMPDMNGIEFGANLQKDAHWAQLKLVLMTNMAPPDDILQTASEVFAAFLPKPVMPRELYTCMAQVLSNDAARRAFFPAKSLGIDVGRQTVDSSTRWPDGARVLLVEDNIVNQDVASLMLADLGLAVDIASNGREAIDRLSAATTPYALVLMDCQMPEMDGFATSRAIRNAQAGELHRNVPIVALTANAMTGDRERCLEAGMNDYLSKPLDDKVLSDKLQQWLLHAGVATERATFVQVPAAIEPLSVNAVVWDEATALRSLKGRQERLLLLVDMLLRGLPEQVANIERSCAQQDFEKIAMYAHMLRGSTGQLRAQQVFEITAALESAARDQRLDACQQKTQQLTIASAALIQVLDAFVRNART